MNTLTGQGTMLPLQSLSPTRTDSFLISARSLMPSFHLLVESGGHGVEPGVAMLAGHIVECLLKAHIEARGIAGKAFGHDLEKLWAIAIQNGLDMPAQTPDWVKALHHLHSFPFMGRYSRTRCDAGLHGKSYPIRQSLVDGLATLVDRVAP